MKPPPPKRRLFKLGVLHGTYSFRIKSTDGKDNYIVSYNPEKGLFGCTCPAGVFRRSEPCKHVASAVCRVARELGIRKSDKPMKQINDTCLNVGPVRLSYLNVFAPRMNDLAGEMQFSATLLIPKEPHQHLADPKTELKGIAAAIDAAALAKFGASVKKFDKPLRDGDVETNAKGEPKHPGYWFIGAKTGESYPPKLINAQCKPVTGGFEAGDWAIAQIRFAAYDFNGKKGVGCYLQAIQFLFVDEHFGGGGADMNSFDEVEVPGGGANAASAEFDPFDQP